MMLRLLRLILGIPLVIAGILLGLMAVLGYATEGTQEGRAVAIAIAMIAMVVLVLGYWLIARGQQSKSHQQIPSNLYRETTWFGVIPEEAQDKLQEQNVDAGVAPQFSEETPVNCPKCRSTQITANKAGFGVGKAAIGGILMGPIGVLGGMIGSRKILITCLNCGHAWEAGAGG